MDFFAELVLGKTPKKTFDNGKIYTLYYQKGILDIDVYYDRPNDRIWYEVVNNTNQLVINSLNSKINLIDDIKTFFEKIELLFKIY